MTCESCGAEVRSLDKICGSCGVALLTVPPVPATPPVPTPDTWAPESLATRKPPRRKPKATAVVTVIAVLVAISLAVGLFVVNGTLATTRSELETTSSQLSAANEQSQALQQRVETLVDQVTGLQKQLRDSQAEAADTRTSLEACQDAWTLAAGLNPATATPAKIAEIQSKLASCFEGKIPPSLFG